VAVRDALSVVLTLGEQVRALQEHLAQVGARLTALEVAK
jgi:hypothetical protein